MIELRKATLFKHEFSDMVENSRYISHALLDEITGWAQKLRGCMFSRENEQFRNKKGI